MRRIARLLKQIALEVKKNQLFDLAAQLAYWSLLAMFPFAMFLLTLTGYLPLQGARDQVLTTAHSIMPQPAAQVLDQVLEEILGRQRGGLLAITLGGALWTASGCISALITGLNRAYEVQETRPWWRVKLLSLVMTLGAVLSVMVATAGLIVGPNLVHRVWDFFGIGGAFAVVWRIIRWPLVVLALMVMLANVYAFLPNVKQRRWRFITPGAVVAVLLWLAASLLFNIYVTHFHSYARTYGALGAIIILMTWLYLSGFTVLFGGEINAVLDKQVRHLKHEERGPAPAAPPQPA